MLAVLPHMDDLLLLRALRLKGRATPPDLAAATRTQEAEVVPGLEALVSRGEAVEKGGRYRLTPEGRDRHDALLAEERVRIDQAALAPLYEEFNTLNARFKGLASSWQQRDGEPNDHTDAAYDGAILDGLAEVDRELQALLPRITALAPRLQSYASRFSGALERIQAGDHSWFLRPIIDSYHTVWFELHEELIGLSGHTREAEAAAGRAD